MSNLFTPENIMMALAGLAALAAITACILAALAARKSSQSGTEEILLREFKAVRDENARLERNIREEAERTRVSGERVNKDNRDELAQRTDTFRMAMTASYNDFSESQKKQFDSIVKRVDDMTQRNDQSFERIRGTMEEKVRLLQEGNEKKLDEMRMVVDEKLQKTLEERLGKSFKLVSDQLEQVYKNLGEMRTLSKDMGDIKNIFSNVKTRGTWGEVQLGALLEQMLTPDQYSSNVRVKPRSDDFVEYAVKLPGQGDSGKPVWMPIDSKFPMEDYNRLQEAVDRSDADGLLAATKALEARVLQQAKDIRDKYIAPPETTDFAILFLPVESLFAEVLRRPGLSERLQRDYRVTVAGPTTLAALLNSLRMGFKTLAIQKRSSEVWELLGAVKRQFGRFADSLEAVQKHLDRASHTVRDASSYTNQIQRRLERVEELPASEAEKLLPVKGLGED
jgi:DNA recombination protein RmuC